MYEYRFFWSIDSEVSVNSDVFKKALQPVPLPPVETREDVYLLLAADRAADCGVKLRDVHRPSMAMLEVKLRSTRTNLGIEAWHKAYAAAHDVAPQAALRTLQLPSCRVCHIRKCRRRVSVDGCWVEQTDVDVMPAAPSAAAAADAVGQQPPAAQRYRTVCIESNSRKAIKVATTEIIKGQKP
eukprot:TRINITY_DN3699_c0_g1_i3.p1 TRINITY_DN3699_c0_g1~~TRINITY_DN3699_c0_g1_i3.p1  ORF type:complete len:183 (+),score=46.69 TRINITY_DN3699_c0_g1_i3:827-1375(+)